MSGKRRSEDHGDSDKGTPDQIRRLGLALSNLDRIAGNYWTGELELTGLKIRLGVVDHFDTMVVVTAQGGDGGPIVAFNSANLPSEAVAGAINRFLNGSLKWKVDEYAARGNREGD